MSLIAGNMVATVPRQPAPKFLHAFRILQLEGVVKQTGRKPESVSALSVTMTCLTAEGITREKEDGYGKQWQSFVGSDTRKVTGT